jgi:hypothetical protein
VIAPDHPSLLEAEDAVELVSRRWPAPHTYYSDGIYTVEVGSRFVDCNGHGGTLEGHSSPYQQSELIDVCCRDPGGNGDATPHDALRAVTLDDIDGR